MAQSWEPTLRRRLMLASLDLMSRVGVVGRTNQSVEADTGQIERILVVEPKNIGDVVLTLPFLGQLRSVFPGAEITMLANPFARVLLEGTGLVDHFIDSNIGWSEQATRYNPLAYNWRALWKLKRELPKRRFDLVFKACMHIREHVVLGLSGGRRRIAYAFGIGDRVLTDAVPIRDPNLHKSTDWLGLLGLFGGVSPIDPPQLRVSAAEARWADEFLAQKGFDGRKKLIGIHPGASVPEKRWPLERFTRIAATLSSRPGLQVIAFVDPQHYGEELGQINGVISARVGLRQLMALIQRCALFVCNDSGPMHIAGALGIPTVAIFGTGINRWFAPLGDGHRLITHTSPGNGVTPYDVADISLERVQHEVDAALSDQA